MTPRKLFELGDYVSISRPQGPVIGKVVATGSRITKLESVLGTIFIIPNTFISGTTLVNLSEKERFLPRIEALGEKLVEAL